MPPLRPLARAASTAAAAAPRAPCTRAPDPEDAAADAAARPAGPRVDWRTRATSKRRPGGLIDPPAATKAHAPRRHRAPLPPPAPGDPWYHEIESYKFRFLDLLQAEEETEQALIRTRLANWPPERLKRDGYCLTGLSAFWLQAAQFGKPVATFLLGPGIALPYHRFENGTQVLLSRLDPLSEAPGQGSIVGSSDTELRVSFDAKLDLADTWRLDLFNTDVAYARMRAAIALLAGDPAAQDAAASASAQPVLQGTHLRDVLLGSFSPPVPAPAPPPAPPPPRRAGAFARDQLIASWARRHAVCGAPLAVEGDPDLRALNATQRRAVATMLAERVSLVQGPPGTGKTRTIIEAVRLLKTHFQVPHPLLVCTYTNVAVDNLVEGLAGAGLRPLRVAGGAGAKVQGALRAHTLDAQLAAHARAPLLARLGADVDRLQGALDAARTRLRALEPLGARAAALRARAERMEADLGARKRRQWAVRNEMVRELVEQADVVCTTCITSASWALNVTDFPVVFLDEASMSTEPASLIPLMKGSEHVALIGDHKQLPPVITSRKAEAGGLGVSLFERLTEEGGVPSVMLDTQYRMHPALSRFPASEFYNLSLFDGTVDGRGEVAAGLLPPASRHLAADAATGRRPSVIFLDHGGGEELKDRSRVNHAEARIVCAVIEDLLVNNATMRGRDIGVIAPYAAQISLLERLLKGNTAYGAQLGQRLGVLRALEVASIEVKTVDGFEGREKEVIIFSTVRNNAGGYIGFLGDRRRMNVGLTRAKRGLFIVGSAGTLAQGRAAGRRSEVWARYVAWLRGNGAVQRVRPDGALYVV